MEIRHLRYFVVVAEQLNVTRAAELLHTSQPSLGRQIEQLEEMLEVKLFARNRHRLVLTEPGTIFLAGARRVLNELNAAMLQTRSAAHGLGKAIDIGYLPTTAIKIFPTLLPQVHEQFPELTLQLHQLTNAQQFQALADGTIDVGFLRGPVEDPSIEAELALTERLFVVLPSAHPLARLRSVKLERIKDLPFVDVSVQVATRLKEIFPLIDFNVARAVGAGNRDNLIDQLTYIGAGLGYTVLTDSVREFAPATVAVRPIAVVPRPEIPMLVAFRKDNHSKALSEFLSVVRYWKSNHVPHESCCTSV